MCEGSAGGHKGKQRIGEANAVASKKRGLGNRVAIHKGAPTGIKITNNKAALSVVDLGVETGYAGLVDDDVVGQVAAQAGARIGKWDGLIFDEDKSLLRQGLAGW